VANIKMLERQKNI